MGRPVSIQIECRSVTDPAESLQERKKRSPRRSFAEMTICR
ncbi:hypothetical protein [Naasia aerilata]|nr:hypothetical protein [Naasia aerilata]